MASAQHTVNVNYFMSDMSTYNAAIYFKDSNSHLYFNFINNVRELENEEMLNTFHANHVALIRGWCNKHTYCIVINFPEISHDDTIEQNLFLILMEKMLEKYNETNTNPIDFLSVFENSQVYGKHFHVVFFSNTKLDVKTTKSFETFFTSFNFDISITNGGIFDILHKKPITTKKVHSTVWTKGQFIKSTASYIHYLQKNPLGVVSNNRELLQMFILYDRTIIFPETSFAKYTTASSVHISQSSKPVVKYFYNLFENGKLDWDTINKDEGLSVFAHIPQLHQIYSNCYTQYISAHDDLDSLMYIIRLGNKQPVSTLCFCSLKEWLDIQMIDFDEFCVAMMEWLECRVKRNAICFQGPPNTGKSHIARLIWQCFPLHTRIIQDGIFSFASLINSGCALWDEPFIPQDIADTTKLVLEGEPDVQITIKGKSSQKLNKRVPILITTNNDLHKYCSSERDALEVRLHKFYTLNVVDLNFCKNSVHYCHFLDQTDSSYNPFSRGNNTESGTGKSEETEHPPSCTGYHPVTFQTILAFLNFLLLSRISNYKPSQRHTKIKLDKFYNLVREHQPRIKKYCHYTLNP